MPVTTRKSISVSRRKSISIAALLLALKLIVMGLGSVAYRKVDKPVWRALVMRIGYIICCILYIWYKHILYMLKKDNPVWPALFYWSAQLTRLRKEFAGKKEQIKKSCIKQNTTAVPIFFWSGSDLLFKWTQKSVNIYFDTLAVWEQLFGSGKLWHQGRFRLLGCPTDHQLFQTAKMSGAASKYDSIKRIQSTDSDSKEIKVICF